MPQHLAKQVAGNLDYFFKQWLAHGKDWGKVAVAEEHSKSVDESHSSGYQWLRGDQLDATFPPEVAAAFKATLKGDPGNYEEHPQLPGVEAAALFRVLVTKGSDYQVTKKKQQTVKVTSDSANNPGLMSNASELLSIVDPNASSSDGGSLPNPHEPNAHKTPEEIAEEAAEKKRRKEEAKAKKAAKLAEKVAEDSKPLNRARAWLRGIPEDIQAARMCLKEIVNAHGVPEETRDEYTTLIDSHRQKLVDLRANFEEYLAEGNMHESSFVHADVLVMKLRKDVDAWKELKKLYCGEPKGA